ncbi:MAG TPA: LytTR family DNA-binding domain-containing protein [Burkholderiaceae bacterium]
MKIRTLIVDDEPLARLNLTSLLAEEPDFEITGECPDGQSAADAIVELHPDLVFLDVQMPNLDGLAVIDALPADRSPVLVFVTAHDRYAVSAFEAQALDYLLKPFRRERFHATLNRVRRALTAAHSGQGTTAPGLPVARPDRMIVKSGGRVVLIPFGELAYVRAAANYVELHLVDRSVEVREKISTMESRLPADQFLRVHRSYLVNLAAVQELYPVGGGEYMIALRNGKQLPVGPTYPSSIRRALDRLPRFGGASGV